MQVDDLVQETGIRAASGRLRFSIPHMGCEGPIRVMVLDQAGSVLHRARVQSQRPRTQMKLTGFPRGEIFLVCAFADDDLVWSTPVQAG